MRFVDIARIAALISCGALLSACPKKDRRSPRTGRHSRTGGSASAGQRQSRCRTRRCCARRCCARRRCARRRCARRAAPAKKKADDDKGGW